MTIIIMLLCYVILSETSVSLESETKIQTCLSITEIRHNLQNIHHVFKYIEIRETLGRNY